MSDQCQIIAIANQKGGVGKTTTAINLGTALAASGATVLLIDFDPQGNAAAAFDCDDGEGGAGGAYRMLAEGRIDAALIRPTAIPNLALIPAGQALAGAEVELAPLPDRRTRLAQALGTLTRPFDYILIDCPPALGMLSINALTAADRVLVPVPCEPFALQGLRQLRETWTRLKPVAQNSMNELQILITLQRDDADACQTLAAALRTEFGATVLTTEIPYCDAVATAAAVGRPVLLEAPNALSSRGYAALAAELLLGRSAGRVSSSRRAQLLAGQRNAVHRQVTAWLTDPTSPLYDLDRAIEHQQQLVYLSDRRRSSRVLGLPRMAWLITLAVIATLFATPPLLLAGARLAPMAWRIEAVTAIVGSKDAWEAGSAVLAQADGYAYRHLLRAARLASTRSSELSECASRAAKAGRNVQCRIAVSADLAAPSQPVAD